MKMELLRKYYNFIVFAVVIVYLVTVFVQKSLVDEGKFTDGQMLVDIQQEWTDENGDPADLKNLDKLPDADGNGLISIYYDLPDELEDEVNLMFLASSVYAECFVMPGNGLEDKSVGYWREPNVSSVGQSYGTAFCAFDVVSEYAGMKVRLDLDLIYSDSGKIMNARLGNRGLFITDYIDEHIPELLLSIVTIIIGLMLSLLALAIPSDRNLRSSLFSFIMTSLFIGLWGISETYILLLLMGNADLWRIADYLVLMILPYILISAVNGILNRPKKTYRDIALLLFVFEVAVVAIGWAAAGWDFHHFKPLIHGMLLVASVIIVYMTLMDGKQVQAGETEGKGERHNMLIFSQVLFTACGLADLFRHYSERYQSDDALFIMRIGFLVFELVMFYRYVQVYRTSMKQVAELNVYQSLAYVDGLTGLGNRNAFLQKEAELIERMHREPDLVVVACSLDMNYLKRMNDTYGHVVGDRYLKAIAEVLKRSFAPDGDVFRCGGDEFGVFLCGDDAELRVIRCLEIMDAEIAEVNRDKESFPEPLSIAYGYARAEGSTADLEKCEARADAMMYKMKREFGAFREENSHGE